MALATNLLSPVRQLPLHEDRRADRRAAVAPGLDPVNKVLGGHSSAIELHGYAPPRDVHQHSVDSRQPIQGRLDPHGSPEGSVHASHRELYLVVAFGQRHCTGREIAGSGNKGPQEQAQLWQVPR